MGGLYAIYFFYLWVSFVNWQWRWVIEFIFLSLSFFKNLPKSFSKVLYNNVTTSMALGTHCKPQGV